MNASASNPFAMTNADAPAAGFATLTGESYLGLTKRERFALAALQASIAAEDPADPAPIHGHARYAVDCADALLAELAK